ncbi:MAG: WD40 repeat domain-containing protein, partial [Planctomycetota bacterium]
MPTGRQLEAFTSPQPAGAVVAAADGSTSAPGERFVAWASTDKTLRVARVSAQQVIVGDVGKVHSAVLFPDGKLLATSGDDRVIKLWNADGTLARQLGGSPVAWRRLAVTGDGALLAAGGDVAGAQPLVHLWKTADGQALPTLTTPVPVVAIALTSDGRLAVAGNDQHVRVYSIADQRLLQDITVPAAITDVAMTADGSALVVTSSDQHLYRYALALERLLAGHQGAVTGVSYAPDGQSLFTAGADKTIRQWDLRDGQTVRLFTGSTAGVQGLALSGDGRTLAASAADNQLRCWTVEPWPAAAKPEAAKPAPVAAAPVVPVNVTPQAAWASPAAVRAVSLSADGQRLAVTSDDSLIRVWDRGSTKEMQRFAGHTGVIHAVSFAPDGRSLATAGADKTVQWWTLSVSQIAVAHEGPVQAIRYSRDGKRIYTAGADKVVRQWDAVTLAKGREYLGAEAAVKCLAVSSDERTIAAGGDDLAVRLWTVADGQSQGVIKLPTAISSVALAGQRADRQVVVASADAIVRTFARELPAANVVVGNAPAANVTA